jgi:glycosyltransferase involved in cell wall biosynthesis
MSRIGDKTVVVHIIPKFVFGGAERLVAQYGQLYDSSEFDVHIIACVEDGPLRSEVEQGSAHVFVASRHTYGGRWGAWRAMKQYLDSISPDIIHTHLLTSDVLGWIYRSRASNRPIWISTQHNVEDTRPWLHKRIWRTILPTADAVIAVAPRVETFTRTVFGVPQKKIFCILNGIPVSMWMAAANVVPCTAPRLRIGTIGRLELQKGHTYALEALAKLPESIQWEYHVYGEGSLESSLKMQAATLGITDRVQWHGAVPDMPDRIAALDIVLQPSLFEGLSLVVLESLAAGRVVVTTPAGGEGVITHGVDGYIVPDTDARAITSVVQHIAAHRDEAQSVARAAHTLGASCTIDRNMQEIESLYRTYTKRT